MNEEKTTFTFKEQTGFGIARSDIELTTGKVIVNDIEITSVEDWERVTNSLIKLQNNWNELKEFVEEEIKHLEKSRYVSFNEYGENKLRIFKDFQFKMQEMEQGKDG